MSDATEFRSENARVSAAIVIPAFNAAATIVETLRAVQACPGVGKLGGVFICDDASTDNTHKLAADAWISAPRLKILQNERRLGERSTVNAAFERLRKDYEWIFILHADDVVKANWLDLYFPRGFPQKPLQSPRASATCAFARWSSLVARRAHNPKVAGSNPARATPTETRGQAASSPLAFFVSGHLQS